MRFLPAGIIFLLLGWSSAIHGQKSTFDSFLTRLSDQYEVEIALAPELIPTLDSLQDFGPGINNVEELLQQILQGKNITYQIVDGNKILLRRESQISHLPGFLELRGTIVDGQTNTPLSFAAVSIDKTHRGTYTDENGIFMLRTDDSTGSLQIHYLGFRPVLIPITAFINGNNIVRMETDTVLLEQVLIVVPYQQIYSNTETHSLELKGYQFLTNEDISNWNAADRLINSITGYTHFSSEQGIRIRGSEEINSLVIMDGIPVYDPYHYYNIFSPFNGNYFSSVSIYKNNIPIEHGGRIDGMIDLRSTDHAQGSSLILETDLLLTSATGDLAISDKVRLMGGIRFSHTAWLNESLRESSTMNFRLPGTFRDANEWATSREPEFNFYDINLGLRTEIGKKNILSFSYFKNKDNLDEVVRNSLTTTLTNQETISLDQTLTSRDEWNNEGVGIELQFYLSEKTVLHASGFLSFFEKNVSYTSLVDEMRKSQHRIFSNTGLQNSLLQSRGLKAFITKQTDLQSNYTLGMDIQRHEVDLIAKENITPYLLELQQETEITVFGEFQQMIFNKIEIAAGSRLTYLNSTDNIYPQPLVRLNYFIDDHWQIKSSFSKSLQVIRELTVENRFGREIEFLSLSQADGDYPMLKADKYMIGGAYASGKFNLDAELYYKKTDGLISVRALKPDPSFRDATSPTDLYRLYAGDGWTAGLDIIAGYKIKNSETSLSYTLSKISQRYEKLFNGNYFSPTEDRRHQIKISTQYKTGQFTVSGLMSYKTKAPYVSLVRLEGQGGIDMIDPEKVLKYLDPYFALDLGLDYAFSMHKWPAQIGVSLINSTNHKNIDDLIHIGRVRKNDGTGGFFLIHETELPGRTFNVHLKVLFD